MTVDFNTARRFRIPRRPLPGSTEINSLDEIPDFDNPEDEIKFWKSFHMSQEMMDQVPHAFDDDEKL